MHARARRGVSAVGFGLSLATAALLTACGDAPDPVEAGAAPVAESTVPPPTEPSSPTTGPQPRVPGTTAEVASPVAGLTPAELRTVVEAPGRATARQRRGPVAERVRVGGRTVWRLTIPGDHELLSSRIVVAVGGTDLGEGVVRPDLTALVAVPADPAVLVAGAPVTYRWGAGAPIAAGPLEVVR